MEPSPRPACGFYSLIRGEQRQPRSALTDAEAIAAMKTSVACTGQYSIGKQSQNGLKATARVDTASSPALPGTDRVYFMKVEGNKPTMKSPGVIEPMTGVTSALVIEFVQAD